MNAYEILGVPRDASADEIHAAYRHLARRLHPDAGGTDVSEMADVNDAWRILSDPVRRIAYDASLPTPASQRGNAVAARAGEYGSRDIGDRLQPLLRLVVASVLALILVLLVAILLIGFGRVGVTPQP